MKRKVQLLSFVVIVVAAIAEPAEEYPIREIIRYPTKEELRADFLSKGKWLMDLKGIPEGDETLVCTNWVCPTSIVVNTQLYVVNTQQYAVETNNFLNLTHFTVMTTNDPPVKVASGDIEIVANGKIARCAVFAHRAQTSLYLPDYARGVAVQTIGPATNMLFVSRAVFHPGYMPKGNLAYKNITLEINAPTNFVNFAAEIINAGLPEGERITLPPAP